MVLKRGNSHPTQAENAKPTGSGKRWATKSTTVGTPFGSIWRVINAEEIQSKHGKATIPASITPRSKATWNAKNYPIFHQMKNDKERILPLVITSQYYSPPSRARPLKQISWSCSPADQRYHREKGVFYPPSFGNRVSGRACRSAGTWGTCGFVFHSQESTTQLYQISLDE